jgi:hypothetical protein
MPACPSAFAERFALVACGRTQRCWRAAAAVHSATTGHQCGRPTVRSPRRAVGRLFEIGSPSAEAPPARRAAAARARPPGTRGSTVTQLDEFLTRRARVVVSLQACGHRQADV